MCIRDRNLCHFQFLFHRRHALVREFQEGILVGRHIAEVYGAINKCFEDVELYLYGVRVKQLFRILLIFPFVEEIIEFGQELHGQIFHRNIMHPHLLTERIELIA